MNSWLAVEIIVAEQNDGFPAWSTGWEQLLGAVFALVLTMFVLLWLYRSMQTPRLFLTREPPAGRPGVTWASVLRYVVLTPIVMFVWYAVILFILTVAQVLDFGKPAAGHLHRIAPVGTHRDSSEPIELGGANEPVRQEVRSS